jgi:hypothetical protein
MAAVLPEFKQMGPKWKMVLWQLIQGVRVIDLPFFD